MTDSMGGSESGLDSQSMRLVIFRKRVRSWEAPIPELIIARGRWTLRCHMVLLGRTRARDWRRICLRARLRVAGLGGWRIDVGTQGSLSKSIMKPDLCEVVARRS